MEDHETPHCDFFTELLIGGELGALAGIFFAPNSGKQPRSDIKQMGSEVLPGGKEIYSDTSSSVPNRMGVLK